MLLTELGPQKVHMDYCFVAPAYHIRSSKHKAAGLLKPAA
jgi:hypothetical protein